VTNQQAKQNITGVGLLEHDLEQGTEKFYNL